MPKRKSFGKKAFHRRESGGDCASRSECNPVAGPVAVENCGCAIVGVAGDGDADADGDADGDGDAESNRTDHHGHGCGHGKYRYRAVQGQGTGGPVKTALCRNCLKSAHTAVYNTFFYGIYAVLPDHEPDQAERDLSVSQSQTQ